MSQRALSVSRTTGNRSTFAQWYQAVVREADMAEPSPVRGAMVIKPQAFDAKIHADYEKWGPIIKAAGIKAE